MKLRNKVILGLLAGLLGIASADEYYISQWKKQHAARFGSVSRPGYSVLKDLPDISDNIRDIEMLYHIDERSGKAKSETLKKLDDRIKSYSSIIEDMRNKLKEPENLQREQLHAMVVIGTNAMSEYLKWDLKDLDIFEGNLNKLLVEIKLSRAGTNFVPKEYMRRIFRDITGKEFPEDVEVVSERQREGIAGYHSALRGVVSSAGLKQFGELCTLLHEAGHVIAQHGEENVEGILGSLIRRYNLDAKVPDDSSLEEACAYAFVNAAIHHISQSNEMYAKALKLIFESHVADLAKKYYEGDDSDEHHIGAAYFLAARDAYGDAKLVFNELSTVRDSSLANVASVVNVELQRARERSRVAAGFEGQYRAKVKVIKGLLDDMQKLGDEADKLSLKGLGITEGLIDWGN